MFKLSGHRPMPNGNSIKKKKVLQWSRFKPLLWSCYLGKVLLQVTYLNLASPCWYFEMCGLNDSHPQSCFMPEFSPSCHTVPIVKLQGLYTAGILPPLFLHSTDCVVIVAFLTDLKFTWAGTGCPSMLIKSFWFFFFGVPWPKDIQTLSFLTLYSLASIRTVCISNWFFRPRLYPSVNKMWSAIRTVILLSRCNIFLL